MNVSPKTRSSYPAWIDVDLGQLRRNWQIINQAKSPSLQILSVVKDQAYGHGAMRVAKVALECGARFLAVATIPEALELRDAGIAAPLLVFGERTPEELTTCLQNSLTCFINDISTAESYAKTAHSLSKKPKVHIEIDTGLSRYGVRWHEALPVIQKVAALKELELEGIMSHFAMSDETDKTFALEQLSRFQNVLNQVAALGLKLPFRHMCNTGGFLDLPQAYFDLVRIGILPLGVYPSQVCRRITGLQPIMTVKTRVAAIKEIQTGDVVGYGMRYRAESKRRIAVLPFGYGDGYPRVRNQGEVLIHGQRAPIIGGNAMDAMMVDITDIPQAQRWDEVVLMGKQDGEEISVHELAKLKNSVSYDIMTGWNWRVPRVYLD